MPPEDVHKTAFVISDGQYEFLQMLHSGATLIKGLEKSSTATVGKNISERCGSYLAGCGKLGSQPDLRSTC